jgi:hypothetical protein
MTAEGTQEQSNRKRQRQMPGSMAIEVGNDLWGKVRI